jgi:hypothetical protein
MDYELTILFTVVTAVVVAIEHQTFGKWWKRNEFARRVMGHGTILAITALGVPFGLVDMGSAIVFALLTGAAGVVMGFYEIGRINAVNTAKEQSLKRMVDNGEQNP